MNDFDPYSVKHFLNPPKRRLEKPADEFDPDWPAGHLLDGDPVRIIARDRLDSKHPIVALVKYQGREDIVTATADGKAAADSYIINAPATINGWVNVYKDFTGGFFLTREEADESDDGDRIACVQIDVKMGEGLKK